MPIIEMPDGAKVSFPDDMLKEQIKEMIMKKFPEVRAKYGRMNAQKKMQQGEESFKDGYFAQSMSGINEGIANTLGLPVDLANNAYALGLRGVNSVAGTNIQPSTTPIGGSQMIKNMMGVSNSIVPPTKTPSKQFARRIGQEVGAAVVPGGRMVKTVERPVNALAKLFMSSLGSGTGAAIANQASPGNSWAELVGQTLGGGLALGSISGAMRATELARDFAKKPPRGISRRARGMLSNDLRHGNVSPEEMKRQATNLGEDAMLADLHPTLRYRAEQIAQSDNPGRSAMIGALKNRDQNAGFRMGRHVDKAFGHEVNPVKLMEDLKTQRQLAAKPLYEKAYGDRLPPSNEIASILGTPSGQKAVNSARQMALDQGFDINPGHLDVRGADEIKKSFDDMISKAGREGGGNQKRVLTGLKNNLVQFVDGHSPNYAQARKTAEENFGLQNAFETGRNMLKRGTHPDQFAADLAAMNNAERNLAVQGGRSAMDEAAGWVNNPDLKTKTFLDQEFKKRNVTALLGPDKSAQLERNLAGEKTFKNTSNQVLGNSATARRANNPFIEINGTKGPLMGSDEIAGRILKFGANKLLGPYRNHLASRAGTALTSQGPVRDAILEALIRQSSRQPVKNTRSVLRALLLSQAANKSGTINTNELMKAPLFPWSKK